jgi:hypothetical protein
MVAYPAGVELEDAESFFSGFYETIPPARRIVTGTTAQVWDNWPNQPVISIVGNEFSEQLDGITFSAWLKESIQAAGNAIVPQIAYRIFDTINNFHNKKEQNKTK